MNVNLIMSIHEIQCEINEIYNIKKELEKKLIILYQLELNGFQLIVLKFQKIKMKI